MADSTEKKFNNCPLWLKAELFEDLLKKQIPQYEKIKEFKVYPALSSGENYATLMLRVEIDLQLQDNKQRKITYVIKVPIENELFNSMLKERNIFDCESKVFRDVLPELEKMYSDVGLDIKFGANCYQLPIETNHVLLEDLKPRGFQNAKRIEGLDKVHIETVLKKLAQWHAVTATRIAIKGNYGELFTKSFFTEGQRNLLETMIKGNVRPFLASIKRKPGDEKFFDTLSKYFNEMVNEVFKASIANENDFNVLNHGDCWANNIMFQYDDNGKIKETFFVDFQLPCYGSPAQDLLYFLISSARYEYKIQLFDYFIKFYHDHLTEYLKLLKYPKEIPTLKNIHRAVIRDSIWAVWSLTGTMAAVNLERTEDANLDNFLSETDEGKNFKLDLYSNERYQKHLDIVLPWLYHRGGLECTEIEREEC